MRILTLTTQFAINYGASLQCYALAHFLNDLPEVECEVIQFNPSGYKRSRVALPLPQSKGDILPFLYSLARVDLLIKNSLKIKKMKKFITNNIPLTKEVYSAEQITHNPPQADVFICGSDQIWNFKIFNKDYTYFFDFINNTNDCKVIAYAPSIADAWTEDQCKAVAPLLHRFDSLSVREVGNVSQVQELVPEKRVISVADPVFLLDKKKWIDLARLPKVPKEPYILCYFLGVSASTVKVVNKIREITGYKIVHLQLNRLDKFNSDEVIRVADSTEFLGLILNAELVCTNSFHCSAFSTIFEKNFCFIPKGYANERAYSLQKDFHLGNIIYTEDKLASLKKEDLRVDYDAGRKDREIYIKKSKQYLLDSIYGKSQN